MLSNLVDKSESYEANGREASGAETYKIKKTVPINLNHKSLAKRDPQFVVLSDNFGPCFVRAECTMISFDRVI